MTYKWFILSNKLKDSKETYSQFVKNYVSFASAMNDAMFAQYVEKTYRLRFTVRA